METTKELQVPEASTATSTVTTTRRVDQRGRVDQNGARDAVRTSSPLAAGRRLLHALAEAGRPPQPQQRLEMLLGPNGSPIWTDPTPTEARHPTRPQPSQR